MPMGEVTPSPLQKKKHTPTTTNPVQQHAPSPCGSVEPLAHPAPPPLRHAAQPEAARAAYGPPGGRSRAAARPRPSPPPVPPPARPQRGPRTGRASRCECVCARRGQPPEPLSSPPRLPAPPGGPGRPRLRAPAAHGRAHGRRRSAARSPAAVRPPHAPGPRTRRRPRARPATPTPTCAPGGPGPPFLCSSRYLHEDYLMTQQGSPQRDRRHFSVFILSLPCDRLGVV
ncbi:proline-rich proteoglycan 2-like [Pteropus medius]|uniref:proline-rich proteoglycan 2-like n=1 Tax=Pteropus vampyrus TaxID=132908 RepID=UPI00196A33DE|nr:proline-rich proteoglycan 2-like [Pteropus giganteus]